MKRLLAMTRGLWGEMAILLIFTPLCCWYLFDFWDGMVRWMILLTTACSVFGAVIVVLYFTTERKRAEDTNFSCTVDEIIERKAADLFKYGGFTQWMDSKIAVDTAAIIICVLLGLSSFCFIIFTFACGGLPLVIGVAVDVVYTLHKRQQSRP